MQGPQPLGKLRSLGQNAVVLLLILWPGDARNRRPEGTIVVEGLLLKIIKEGAERVEILLRCGVVFVIVTDGATNRQAHERGAVGFGSLPRNVHAQLFGN